MAEGQQPEEGSAEALAQELKKIPSDRAIEVTPSISKRFDEFTRMVYPHVLTSSKQYSDMKMLWHIAYLDFLDLLTTVPDLSGRDEQFGAEILHCLNHQVTVFLEEYNKNRKEAK